ncbi:MAG TPA: hypothetical protein ENH55_19825 [Aurantimonas coralicida]|uniref:Peptidase n=2 Tax=root TaxID=1 RepID=A0A9C9NCU7_9HYPH|nr:hypothetical protein [Aurantimonas coralicida]HET99497.1 hypothetical protein [Aurantimonas coralicida]
MGLFKNRAGRKAGDVHSFADEAGDPKADAGRRFGPIEVFRVGKWTPMNGKEVAFSEDDLRQIAESYDPKLAPAPVVIGHPQSDAPAYAWVDSLQFQGGKLTAMLKDAAGEFVDWVKAGRYRKVSISLFTKDAPANPVEGALYLRHVGFLGGAAPAVSGLKPVEFSCGAPGDDGALEFAFNQVEADRTAIRRERDEMRLEKLLTAGHVLPVFKDEILAFVGGMEDDATFSFSDGTEKPARDWFFSYLERQPLAVHYGRFDMGEDPFKASREAKADRRNVPEGYAVDPDGLAAMEEIDQLAKREGINFSEAAQRYGKGQRHTD